MTPAEHVEMVIRSANAIASLSRITSCKEESVVKLILIDTETEVRQMQHRLEDIKAGKKK